MGTAVALLSGKGGSGKTTLSLGIADILCRCKIHTLLVDCDMNTNGATYFYEKKIYERKESESNRAYSFADILNGVGVSNSPVPLSVKDSLDFMPSVSEISESYLSGGALLHNVDAYRPLRGFIEWAKESYDVVLFDCQAGYSEFLPELLPQMDVDLFVLEADSISASAMRSLHLKVGNFFGKADLYQVFNKVTQEEFEIYSKITAAFFNNIGALFFDWKVRQAFSRSQVPDFETTGARHVADLCDVCKVIFRDVGTQERLDTLASRLSYQQLEEKSEEVEINLSKLRTQESKEKKEKKMIIFLSIFTFLSCVLVTTLMIMPNISWPESTRSIFSTMVSCISALAVSLILLYSLRRDEGTETKRLEYEQELKRIDRELAKFDKGNMANSR